MTKTYVLWGLFLVLPCYVLDQVTKFLVMTHLEIGQAITIIPGYFEILHVRNTGAAFGMFQNMPPTFRLAFFLVITLVACAAIIYIFRQSQEQSIFLKILLCLILAGALGNLTDRIMHAEVVDFLNMHLLSYRWPTFNVADMYISAGMVGLIAYSLLGPKPMPPDDVCS